MQFVYITTGSEEEALLIARTLVAEKLAACVNLLPGVRSVYEWEGRVREGKEWVLIAKTTKEGFSRLQDRVMALHSYDCPCVVSLAITDGNPAFLDWIGSQVAGE